MAHDHPRVTIVVPAHNEERGLARLLPALLGDAEPGEFRVIVVCNGCTDASAARAREFGPDVDVIELEIASKAAALEVGIAQISDFPAVFVDADVLLDTRGVRAMAEFLGTPGTLATAPERDLDRTGVSRIARSYYDVWERLPQVRAGLFGRGVIAMNELGLERVRALPRFISDDLAYSESFSPAERGITTDALVTVWPARTWRALLHRRIRVVEGSREYSEREKDSGEASTGAGDLIRIMRAEPAMTLRMPVFVGTAIAARVALAVRGRRQREWLRDETSRTA
jgi:glycosyltransferase involved in cell wall biosynthesis